LRPVSIISRMSPANKLDRNIADNASFANYLMFQVNQRINDMSRSDGLFLESLAAAMLKTSDGLSKACVLFFKNREPKFG